MNKFRAKSRTDRDPVQFGRTFPWPGRTLPEVTTWRTAQGCTGCTALVGTWHSADPGPRETYPSQYWVKIHNWVSDLPQLKIWCIFAVITRLILIFYIMSLVMREDTMLNNYIVICKIRFFFFLSNIKVMLRNWIENFANLCEQLSDFWESFNQGKRLIAERCIYCTAGGRQQLACPLTQFFILNWTSVQFT